MPGSPPYSAASDGPRREPRAVGDGALTSELGLMRWVGELSPPANEAGAHMPAHRFPTHGGHVLLSDADLHATTHERPPSGRGRASLVLGPVVPRRPCVPRGGRTPADEGRSVAVCGNEGGGDRFASTSSSGRRAQLGSRNGRFPQLIGRRRRNRGRPSPNRPSQQSR
jgi:hypothetical protein